MMKLIKVYKCNGYFKHRHLTQFGMMLCNRIQSILPVSRIHYHYLRIFNPEKLLKIMIAMKGSNKRKMLRRIKKGKQAI